MNTPLAKIEKFKYYRFYWDYDYDTENCRDLKEQIEKLIHREHGEQFV